MTASSRRSRLIVLPTVIVVVLAVVWSAVWFVAARATDANIAAWIEHEAALGRLYACGTRSAGGYPFRIEVRCTDPKVELRNVAPALTLTGRELVAVAQVYRPTHIIAEIAGPVSIAENGRPAYTGDWKLAQASIRGLSAVPERVSVVVDEIKLERVAETGGQTFATASHAELHVRRDPTSPEDNPAFDLALQVAGATVPVLGSRQFDAETLLILRGLRNFEPKPILVRLKEWQAAGGRLDVANVRVRQGEAIAVATGAVGLSARGRLDGAIDIKLAGFEQFLQTLLGQGRGQAGMFAGAGLALIGKPDVIDGKRAIAVSLRFNDGAVSVGPLRLGQTPALF